MADTKPEVECFSGTEWDINEIPTATPTFSTTSELVVNRDTADVVRHQRTSDFKMAKSKPEVEYFFRTGKEEDITRIIIMCQRVVVVEMIKYDNYLSLFPSKCFISPLFGHIGGHLGFLECHVTNAK